MKTKLTVEEFEQAQDLVRRYLADHPAVNNTGFRTLTGFNYDQAIHFFARAIDQGILERIGKSSGTKYILSDSSKQ